MKFTTTILFSLLCSANVLASSDKSCSTENMDEVIALSARIIGEQAADETKIFKLVMREKSTVQDIRQGLLSVKKTSKAPQAAINLDNFLKAHPECDKKKRFTTEFPY